MQGDRISMTEPTNLSDKQRNDIEKVGRWVLEALDEIAQWAEAQLKHEQPKGDPNDPTWASIRASLAEIRQGALLLRQEPAIVRIMVQWQTTKPEQQDVSHLSRGIRGSTNGRGGPCRIL